LRADCQESPTQKILSLETWVWKRTNVKAMLTVFFSRLRNDLYSPPYM
jgi:hypothetical protein